MEQRITMISLGVRDLKVARAFYEKLGWIASPDSKDSIVFFQMGGMVLGLYGRADLAEDAGVEDSEPGFSGVAIAWNGRSESEVDAALAQAVAAGGKLIKPAQKVFWGGYSGYFADPDGHLWEVAHNPFLAIAEDGSVRLAQ